MTAIEHKSTIPCPFCEAPEGEPCKAIVPGHVREHRSRTETERNTLAEQFREAVEALREVTEALDDAIAHNVNATADDPAGWTQEEYDTWDSARARGTEALGRFGGQS